MSKNKVIFIFLAILLVIGFWLRVYQIDQVLFTGEEITYLNGAAGLYHTGNFEIWNFAEEESIKPFTGDKIYTAQIALSYFIFGISELSTRLISILWGLLLMACIYCFAYNLSKDRLISLFAVFCLVFSNFFIQASHFASPVIMYASLFFLGVNLFFLKQKIAKISAVLLIFISALFSILYLDINLVTPSNIISRYDDFFSHIFEEFRIVWLVAVPAIIYLLESKWWKSRKYLLSIIFILAGSVLIPLITDKYNYQNYYFLIILPIFWFFAITGIKHITRHKKEIIFILIALTLITVPSFPLIPGIKPLTNNFIIQESQEKEKMLSLYQDLVDNKLDNVHLVSPVDYYLTDYSFSYQKHSSVEKYKVDNIKKYLNKEETGYLIFKKELERKMSHQKMKRIRSSFYYHFEISELTDYYVFSWGPEEAEKFINYEN